MALPFLYSVNGVIVQPEEAVLPLPDDGLFRGDGVFEVARIYDGRPFAMDLHLDRMERSAESIELALDRSLLEAEASALIASAPPDSLIRLVATRAGNRVLTLEPLPDHKPTITLATVTYSPTVILNGVKSLSYSANMQATRIAQRSGADEALLVGPDGIVLEPPTSSIFWANTDGRIHTPALECGVLDSITRRKIIERLDVVEGEFSLSELLGASEAFLASTTREAHPVSRIDGQEMPIIGGEAALSAARAFREALEEDLKTP